MLAVVGERQVRRQGRNLQKWQLSSRACQWGGMRKSQRMQSEDQTLRSCLPCRGKTPGYVSQMEVMTQYDREAIVDIYCLLEMAFVKDVLSPCCFQ